MREDAADTPWGPAFLITLPGVRFDSGDRLPPAARWYYPDVGEGETREIRDEGRSL
jgi:hypothetical protein